MKRLLVIAVICVLFSACAKEEQGGKGGQGTSFTKGQKVTLSVNAVDQTKVTTALDGTAVKFKWELGDKIKVTVGESSSAEFEAVELYNDGASAKFEGTMPDGGQTFKVQFPATDPDLSSQTYSSTEALPKNEMLVKAAACSLGTAISLAPQYAALRLKLYGTETIGQIVVTNTSSTMTPKPTYTLTCTDGVSLSGSTSEAPKNFFVILPTGTYNINVKFYNNAATPAVIHEKDIKDQTFSANQIKSSKPKELTGPVFSVGETKKVKFAKGNLYWDGSAYHLETNQTDYPTTWSTSHVGHFYWSKTASVAYAQSYFDSSASSSDTFFFAEGNSIAIDGNFGYYTLSMEEWIHLTSARPNANILFKIDVTVNDIDDCLVIAPDGYSGTIADSYNASAWAAAEAAGLVCLPPAGSRNGTIIDYPGENGLYWSSTPNGSDIEQAYYLYFEKRGGYIPGFGNRKCGDAIRLVYEKLTDYPGTDLEPVTIDGVTWAPVNCGYDASHPYGLLYQWGRKYGQAYEDGKITPTTMNKTDDTEENKGKYGYDSTYSNWFSGSLDNTLWNDSKGDKDPCPPGWRVPKYNELKTLITNYSPETSKDGQKGRYFSGKTTYADNVPRVFLPEAGARYYSDGRAERRNSYGQYWSSTYQGNNAWYLYYASYKPDMGDGNRANGCSVRCVQE